MRRTRPRAHVVGLTGPPGVGKSTLLGVLIAALRAQARSVGVIAIDPSSRRSGGALLGDRLRLATDPHDEGIFVRSMAARDRLGGLADFTVAAMVVMRALHDMVFVETVGVGQSETDVAGAADTVVFCAQPASGDGLQFMKAGIVEVPHVAVVTKGDLGEPAARAAADLASALGLSTGTGSAWQVPVLTISARRGEGIEKLIEAIDRHWQWLGTDNRLAAQRHEQSIVWLTQAIRDKFGRDGLIPDPYDRFGPPASTGSA